MRLRLKITVMDNSTDEVLSETETLMDKHGNWQAEAQALQEVMTVPMASVVLSSAAFGCTFLLGEYAKDQLRMQKKMFKDHTTYARERPR
jgi:hypothetical protein